MTEEEAKTKWCPMVGGRPSKEYPSVTNCIGSECMWWISTSDAYHKTGYCGHIAGAKRCITLHHSKN